ncbi:MAG TPA: hypothetical protein VFU71_20630 [Burkholderiaceae bacterium]|nr:hypothetical protein [Burkholderiaceae bacterium]
MTAALDPLLIDWPPLLPSERVLLRPPRAGDGAALSEAVTQSIDERGAEEPLPSVAGGAPQRPRPIKAAPPSAAKTRRPHR